MKTVLSLSLVVLPLLGIADASYLTYEKLSGSIPVCGPGFDCGTVLQSQWSSIGPIPLSVFGLLFYLTMLTLAIANYLELKPKLVKKFYPGFNLLKSTWLVSSFGFFFSAFLVFIMGVVIKAWCLYCLLSAAISSLIFFITTILFFNYNYKRND